jgi:hypothetical protein
MLGLVSVITLRRWQCVALGTDSYLSDSSSTCVSSLLVTLKLFRLPISFKGRARAYIRLPSYPAMYTVSVFVMYL